MGGAEVKCAVTYVTTYLWHSVARMIINIAANRSADKLKVKLPGHMNTFFKPHEGDDGRQVSVWNAHLAGGNDV